MTVHAVMVDPPREGLVMSSLVETSTLAAGEAADLYAAMAKDVFSAAATSGGELLVNYRADEDLPSEFQTGDDAESAVRELAAEALSDLEDVRFEIQVGSTRSARAGNTATHLLREDGVDSVAIVDPRAPTLARTVLDSAAMKLRRNEVVIAPGSGGAVPYLGVSEPIDFENVFSTPEINTITDRALDAGRQVDFTDFHPLVRTGEDLASLLSMVEARTRAERRIPVHTAELLAQVGLRVVEDGSTRTVTRT